MQSICVLGMGYIGLPTALLFANSGNHVIGVDINKQTVESLSKGKMPFEENGFQNLLDDVIERKTFRVENQVEGADVFLIAVPTPLDSETRLCDLSYVILACKMVVPHLRKGNLVIIESTIPPGTTKKQAQSILETSNLKASADFHLVHCPERAMPGNTLYEMVHNDRIIGGIDAKSNEFARSLYSCFSQGRFHLTDSTTAEMVKLMENTYRDTNIALANEFALIAEEYGIDIWEAINIANMHPRVNILNPGPGVGGHCIAIDPWFLTEDTNKGRLISLSRQINDSMPNYVLRLARKMLKGIRNPTITILGVSYKADTADTRSTPAKKFIKLAENEGYEIRIHDPYATNFDHPILDLTEAVKNSDCIILLTDHKGFKNIQPEDVFESMSHHNIIDTRNFINADAWKSYGFNVCILGGFKDARNE
jgi:UDP-N-acetyl-D-mannosaminuronic acid dehydrogenase